MATRPPLRARAGPTQLRAAEAARLVQRRVLPPPERTSCTSSSQALAAMKTAMVTVTAYGDTLMLSSPKGAKPWTFSLERRSSASRPQGEGMELFEAGCGGQQEAPRLRGFNPLSLF